MENKIKENEKKALLVGLALILIVALLTFFRPSDNIERKSSVDSIASEKLSRFGKLSPDELKEKIRKRDKIIIIDIRSSYDYEFEHIAESINAPLETLASMNLGVDKTGFVVLVDTSVDNQRYYQGAEILSGQGFTNINILTGGMTAWTNNQGNVVDWGDPTSFINQSKVNFISQDEVKAILSEEIPYYIIDVREKNSYMEFMPNSVNIPLADIEKKKSEIPLSQNIIVYGSSELEAFQAGVKLYDLGILSAQVMEGNFNEWKDKGYPIKSN